MSRPLPEGSWDCHAHVLEDRVRYPLAPGRGYEPPEAPLRGYLDFLDHFGLARGVLVQPSVYGFDNRCLLDALHQAEGRLAGVAVPEPSAGPGDLEALDRGGVRGIRCNLLNPGGLHPETVSEWQPVLRGLGWHVEFHIDVDRVGDLRAYLDPFTVPVVIDHMGRIHPGRGGDAQGLSPGFRQVLDLVREGGCFVKLSAPYRLSAEPPPWRDVAPLARALLEANPSRCLWASDWPHVDTGGPVHADDLAEALAEWTEDAGTLRTMMAEGPEALFGSA